MAAIGLAALAALALPVMAAPRATTAVKKQADPGLALEVKLPSSRIRPDEHVVPQVTVVNRSKKLAFWVVQAGDGSEVGWREPHVWYSATRLRPDGRWGEVARRQLARCGVYDPDWEKEVVELKPGARLTLAPWIGSPTWSLDLSQPGRYRLVVHYAYRGGTPTRSGRAPTGPIAAQAPYEIASAPVEIEVVAR